MIDFVVLKVAQSDSSGCLAEILPRRERPVLESFTSELDFLSFFLVNGWPVVALHMLRVPLQFIASLFKFVELLLVLRVSVSFLFMLDFFVKD